MHRPEGTNFSCVSLFVVQAPGDVVVSGSLSHFKGGREMPSPAGLPRAAFEDNF